ncbi:MAG: NAD(P)H-dependent oxidoreductase [Thermoplasmata archaeon]|nr:NAD(P)H-dependent oxidoreductase [Thermoplasmata archaeon]
MSDIMPNALIVYYSRSGATRTMAEEIGEALKKEGIDVAVQKVEDTKVSDLLGYDGIIMGSPTYYGTMAAELKKLIDDSVEIHGKLDGKVGAAFATAAVSGFETTVFSILEGMLIHGMIIQGNPAGDHYGAVAVGEGTFSDSEWSSNFAKRVADLIKRL